MSSEPLEMFQHLPFPFPDSRFPRELGAVIQRTVLDGTQPARLIAHDLDGSWLVGDGVTDPNLTGAVIATHIWHAIERNSSLADLADLAPGSQATRSEPEEPWSIGPFEYEP